MDEQPAQRSSTANLIRVLEDEILGGVLRPGDKLDEKALAKRFDVSRTPVREALYHPSSSGLVEIRRNQGAAVKSVTTSELIEMFQVLAEMEGLASRLCTRRMTDQEIQQLRAINDECLRQANANDHLGFFASNHDFHALIYSCAQNNFLMTESSKLRRRIDVYRRHITYQPRRMVRSVDEHYKIVEAIEQGVEERAHILMREHVDLLAGSATDVLVALEAKHRE